jgi:hypothetical protein
VPEIKPPYLFWTDFSFYCLLRRLNPHGFGLATSHTKHWGFGEESNDDDDQVSFISHFSAALLGVRAKNDPVCIRIR